MEETFIVNNVDNFFRVFVKKHGFSAGNIGGIYKYKVPDAYGSGYIERLSLRNGIEICSADIYLHKSIRLFYRIDNPIFEVTQFMSGSVQHFEEGMGAFHLNEGNMSICIMQRNAQGWMEYPKDTPIKNFSIAACAPFIESFAKKDPAQSHRPDYEEISQEKICALMRPRPINPAIKAPFMQMANCQFTGINRLIYMEGKALEIISVALEKEVVEHSKKHHQSTIKISDTPKIYAAGKIIADNIMEPLSIKELAKRIGLNTYKLKVGFKDVYGTTIFGYMKEVRVEKARALLLENEEMNIMEVANEVGYANPSHFAKAFRNKYGVNPREFVLSSK